MGFNRRCRHEYSLKYLATRTVAPRRQALISIANLSPRRPASTPPRRWEGTNLEAVYIVYTANGAVAAFEDATNKYEVGSVRVEGSDTVSSRASVVAGHRHRINARTQKWRCSSYGRGGCQHRLSDSSGLIELHRWSPPRVTPPLPIGGRGECLERAVLVL